MEDICIVCAELLQYTAYAPCGHKDACSKCVSRLRSVLKDPRCVYCQVPSDSVFVTRFMGDYTATVPAEEFDALPDRAKRGELQLLDSAQAFFDDPSHFREISSLCSYTHPCAWQDAPDAPRTAFSSLEALKAHLQQQHKLQFCNICLEGRKVFVSEQQLYSKVELARHMRCGDVKGPMEAAGFKGHPECRFCRKRYYGENELYQHMHAGHEQCFLCRRANPHKYVYFRDYADLEDHFQRDHFPCPHPACLEKKFVVFSSEQEFKTHTAREHGETLSKLEKKAALTLQMNFQYRREDVEGGRGGVGGRNRGGRGGGFSSGGIPPEAPHPLAAVLGGERRAVVIGSAASVPSQLQQRSRPGSRSNLHEAMAASVETAQVESAMHTSQQQQQQQGAANAPLLSEADFPSVSGTLAVGGSAGGRWAGAGGGMGSAGGLSTDDFPSLPGVTKSAKRRAAKKKSLASVLGGGGEVRVHKAGGRPPLPPGGDHFPALAPQQQRQQGSAASTDDESGGASADASRPGSSASSQPTSAEGFVALQREDWESVLPWASRRRGEAAGAGLPRPPSTQELAGPPPEEPHQQWLQARKEQQQEKKQLKQREQEAAPAAAAPSHVPQVAPQAPAAPAPVSLQVAPAPVAATPPAALAAAGPVGISEALRAANKLLIEKIRSQLDMQQFAQFRQQSASWVRGQISSQQYHKAVAELGLVSVIPDLASTCPDAIKRAELLAVHRDAFTPDGKGKGKGKWVPPEAATVAARLAEQHSSWRCDACTLANAPFARLCEACGQVRPGPDDASNQWKQQQQQQQQKPGGALAPFAVAPAAPAPPSRDSFPALPTAPTSACGQGSSGGGCDGTGRRQAKKNNQPLHQFLQAIRVPPQNAWRNPSLRGQWAEGGGGTLAAKERALLDAYSGVRKSKHK